MNRLGSGRSYSDRWTPRRSFPFQDGEVQRSVRGSSVSRRHLGALQYVGPSLYRPPDRLSATFVMRCFVHLSIVVLCCKQLSTRPYDRPSNLLHGRTEGGIINGG